MIIDKAYWVVFNPSQTDFDNSNETAQTAQKDIEGIRYWLTKKAGSEEYDYTGTGNYTGGPIANISAIYMTPEQLGILAGTPRYFGPLSFDQIKQQTADFSNAEDGFKQCFLSCLAFSMLQNDATPANIAAAYTNLDAALTSLHNFDFDNCYLQLSTVELNTSFTQATKDDVTDLIKTYLEKYPR